MPLRDWGPDLEPETPRLWSRCQPPFQPETKPAQQNTGTQAQAPAHRIPAALQSHLISWAMATFQHSSFDDCGFSVGLMRKSDDLNSGQT